MIVLGWVFLQSLSYTIIHLNMTAIDETRQKKICFSIFGSCSEGIYYFNKWSISFSFKLVLKHAALSFCLYSAQCSTSCWSQRLSVRTTAAFHKPSLSFVFCIDINLLNNLNPWWLTYTTVRLMVHTLMHLINCKHLPKNGCAFMTVNL